MKKKRETAKKTLVGTIDPEILQFTVGKDSTLDRALVEADCIGSAAHVSMLALVPVKPPLISRKERDRVTVELVRIIKSAREGRFRIRAADQDVHLAVERTVTSALGETGRKIHTARSRNDQVAVDLRLYAKQQLLETMQEMADLGKSLLKLARRNLQVPMVGRTHQQPAMPSSVGVWSSAYAESLLDDAIMLRAAYDLNNRCPLGSAAGYGVPLPIDRNLTSRLLGFEAPVSNVLHASNTRGKCEAAILSALVQVMITLARLSRDLILYSMPEFGYFKLPAQCCTGSSIMPQKKNPDVLELIRAKATRVQAAATTAGVIVAGIPGGYSRDLQEIKEPFLDGMQTTRACLRVMALLVGHVEVDKAALLNGFNAGVFATDRALELVAEGVPFREAYDRVREGLSDLADRNPREAIAAKTHLGAPAGLDLKGLDESIRGRERFVRTEKKRFHAAVSKLLGMEYPGAGV